MSDCKPCKSETLNYFNHDGNYHVDCKSKNKIYRCIYDVKLVPINNEKKIKELDNELSTLNKKYLKEVDNLQNNFEKRLKKNSKDLISKKNSINKNLDEMLIKINELKSNINLQKKRKFNKVISKKIKKYVNLTYNTRKKEPKKVIKKQNNQKKQSKQKKQVKQ